MKDRCLFAVILALYLALPCGADSIAWYSVNSGGGVSTSAEYTMQGTIGQPVTGIVTSPPYTSSPKIHYIGFWSGDLREPALQPSIHLTKTLPEGAYISLSGLYVTTQSPTDFGDRIYLEAGDRSSGIQFYHGSASIPALAEGSQVSVVGTTRTLDNGEVALVGSLVTPLLAGSPTTALRPLGIRAAQIGGKNSGLPAGAVGQRGTTGAVDLNNSGLLVRVWGVIAGREVGTNYLLISDGSVPTSDPLRVDPSRLTSIPESGYIQITGISSVEYRGSALVPVLRPRRQTDLTPLIAP